MVCPFCGGEVHPDEDDSYEEAIKAEIKRIASELTVIAATVKSVQEEQRGIQESIEELHCRRAGVNRTLEEKDLAVQDYRAGLERYRDYTTLKAKGFKRATVAKRLNIDRRTVGHYWNMSVDEFETYLDRQRRESSLDHYKQTIIAWLREYPTLSAAQVCDWLKEHYSEDYSERTVSRYVKKMGVT